MEDGKLADILMSVGIVDQVVMATRHTVIHRIELKDGTYWHLVNPSDWLIGQIYHDILTNRKDMMK